MRYLSIVIGVLGLISLVLGVVFIVQGANASKMVTEEIRLERATYKGELEKLTPQGVVKVEGKIEGVIDTAEEAKLVADMLKAHRSEIGYYTELNRDDPKRQTILNAMTMENSLGLGRLAFGVSDMVKASGVFMLITGIAFVVSGLALYRMSGIKVYFR